MSHKRKSSKLLLFTFGIIIIQSLLLVGIPLFKYTTTSPFDTTPLETSIQEVARNTREIDIFDIQSFHPEPISSNNDLPAIISASLSKKDPKLPQSTTEAFKLRSEQPPSTNESSLLSLAYHVKSGDTLSSIWKAIGGDITQAHQAAKAFKKADVPLSSIKAGEILDFTVDASGHVEALRKPLSDGQSLILTSIKSGAFSPEIIRPQIIRTERFVSGSITHSLAHSSVQQGVPYEVVDEFIDLFSGRVEFSREVQQGDTFTVIYNERNTERGNTLSPGPIQAASFMNNGEMFVAIRYKPASQKGTKTKASYYNAKGEPIGNHFLRYPLKFSRISSVFTKARFHPVLKRWRPHHGVDFAAPTGTPVRTVADGKIVRAGYHGGNGNMVKIQHSDKYASAYLHLSRIAKGIRVGSRVERGQLIGAVGSTGLATGPHLHYSFYVHGKYVDPLKVRLPSVAQNVPPIPQKFLHATLRKLKREHADLKMASTSALERNA